MATKPQHYHWQKKLPFLLSCGQHFAGILPLSQWLCRKSTTRFMSRRMRRHFSPVKRVSSLILRANKVLRHAMVLPLGFADAIFPRERSDDRKCVCCSQAILNAVAVKCIPPTPSWFFPVESKILFYIFLVESRTPLTIEIQKPASSNKKHVHGMFMESGTQGVKSRIQQCLGFHYTWGEGIVPVPQTRKCTVVPKFKSSLDDMKNYLRCDC